MTQVDNRMATLRALRNGDPRALDLMSALPYREHHIVAHHLALGGGHAYSFPELATQFGVSTERIRQVYNQSIAHIESRLFTKEEP